MVHTTKILSIIVPVYNVEKYITKCLDSLVLDDPELMKQLEVIIVNDGTPDRSAELSREYVKRYPETFRQIDKKNGNYGSCINRGLAEAQGRYIKILDADDWYDTGEFRNYLEALGTLDVDMVLNDYRIVNPEGEVTSEVFYDIPDGHPFDFESLKDSGLYISMHSIAYRTSLLRDMNYVQTEGISYTDNEWAYFPQISVRTCAYLKKDVYRYVMGREGQTMDPKVLGRSASQKVRLMESMISFCCGVNGAGRFLPAFNRIQTYIEHTSLGLYRFLLIKQPATFFDAGLLASFDEFVRDHYGSLYDKAGSLVLKRWAPIKYVSLWRRYGLRLGNIPVFEKLMSGRQV